MIWGGLPTVIIGTSGISKEVKTIIDEINQLNYINQFSFLGFISEKEEEVGERLMGEKIIASDSQLDEFFSPYKQIGVIIPIGTPKIKKKIFSKLKKYNNIVYPNIVSPTAKIMDIATINFGMGNIICSGCTLTAEIDIGNFNLVNLNSTIGHNAQIGDYCVINPLSSISGDVKIFDEVLCGAGCIIKQGVRIENNSIIGLGAFIVKDVKENSIMICKSAVNMVKEQ